MTTATPGGDRRGPASSPRCTRTPCGPPAARSSPCWAAAPRAPPRASTRCTPGRGAADLAELLAADDVDVVHICTPNATHLAMARGRARRGQARVCEKPLATSVADAQRLVELAAAGRAAVASVPFVYRFYASVREARERIARDTVAPLWLLHGTYLQDWLSSRRPHQLAGRPGAGRRLPRLRRHRRALVRPHGVHDRPPDRAAVGPDGQAFPQRRSGTELADVHTEDGAVVVFETDQGAIGSRGRLPGDVRAARTASGSPSTAPTPRTPSTRRCPRRSGSAPGRRTSSSCAARTSFGKAASTYSRLPAGHPQGYQDAFNAYVEDVYAAIAGGCPDGLPTFADGLRAAVLTQAVVDAAASADLGGGAGMTETP